MNHHHRKVLHSLFAHPISANIDFKQVVSVFKELGAEIDDKTGARIGVNLNGHSAAFHHAQHSVPKEEIVKIRHFLEGCGVTPDAYPV